MPKSIDPFKFCKKKTAISGQIDVRQLKRLSKIASTETGVVTIDLVFEKNSSRVNHVHGSIDAVISLICQNCLKEFDTEFHLEMALAFVTSESGMMKVEPMESVIVEDSKVDLFHLIEDELILALPISAKHKDCKKIIHNSQLGEIIEETIEKKENPFEILKQMKH